MGASTRLLSMAILSAVIGGCASPGHYPRYEHAVCPTPDLGLATAGRDARDCGLLDDGDSAVGRQRMRECARAAYASGEPFRFGRGFVGVDWAECTVAVRTRDGQVWSMEYGYDFSSCPEDESQCPRLFVGRCKTLEFVDSGPMVFYRVADCMQDPEGFERERPAAE